MKQIYLFIIVMMCATISTWAQDNTKKVNIDLQMRARSEVRDGALIPKAKGNDIAAFVNNRTRLNVDYSQSFLKMGLSLQHVGVWGDDKQVHKNADMGVHEAWAQMNFAEHFFVKLGRQTISYDDQRILGALNWHVAGRHHDALKLGYANKQHKLHLILAYNQNKENVHGNWYDATIGQPYKSMQTLWYNVSVGSASKLSFLFMNLGVQGANETHFMQTAGTYMNISITPKFSTQLSGYYQFGENTAKKTLKAYMLSAVLAYKITPKVAFKVGSDYLSGNTTDTTQVQAFNPLYGTHHKFYGHMDYFFVSPFAGGLHPGLWDTYIGLNTSFNPKLSAGLVYHYFQFTGDVFNAAGEDIDKGLASEIDFNIKYKLHKDITLVGGLSCALLSESMDIVKGGDHNEFQSWGWISINIAPRIFAH